MTQEDWRKKYEAIKHRVYEVGAGIAEGVDYSRPRSIAEYIDPELSESEDDRIRKEIELTLTSFVADNDSALHPGAHYTVKEAISWLEKQKYEVQRQFNLGVQAGREEAMYELEREQKPVKLNDDTEVGLDRALQIVKHAKGNLCCYQSDDGIYECDHAIQTLERILKNGIEQKPTEWSGEDEEHRESILKRLDEMCEQGATFTQTRFAVSEDMDWLKSFRFQPKAELTLLDKNIIEAAVAFVEQNDHFNCWGGIDKHTVIKALRSLKPHWKPSEEQMEELLNALTPGKDFDCDILAELYGQLKKL